MNGKNSDTEILHDDIELSEETEEQLSRYNQSERPQQVVPFQPSLEKARESERRIADRRYAERRVESPTATQQWRETIQARFNGVAGDMPQMEQWGAMLHLINQFESQQNAIDALTAEVAALRTEVALKHSGG